ncbi:MAG: ribosome small subunit-dependent GTPase A [Prevotellaceae bacterium]|jgi:ribosome biogenesis GTPase|nr:ribosome small subunit-dependent GTPase A [Prevotellaceae bacterium]
MMNERHFEGTVFRHTGSRYMVKSKAVSTLVGCVVRGKLRLHETTTTNPVAIGDIVDCEMVNSSEGIITAVHPRRNYIIRRAANLSHEAHIIAANIDCAYLIVTISHPRNAWAFIDRFLVTCEAYSVPVKLIINKVDLYGEAGNGEKERFVEIYTQAGYEVVEVSAKTGFQVDGLRRDVCGKFCLFSGASGVGKSSLINALDPTLTLRTGALSKTHQKGMHTTTFYEVFELASGGAIVDSPGIKGFGLIEVNKEELYHFFPELFRMAAHCKFNPCTHTHEPQCAVRQAVNDGRISSERYDSYSKMLRTSDGKYR